MLLTMTVRFLTFGSQQIPPLVDERLGVVFREPALDRPHKALALFLVRLHRLLVDELVDLRVAVAVVVADPAAGVALVKHGVRVVDLRAGEVQTDGVILALDPRIPLRRIDRIELGVDPDLLQLVDQDYRRIAIGRDIASRW